MRYALDWVSLVVIMYMRRRRMRRRRGRLRLLPCMQAGLSARMSRAPASTAKLFLGRRRYFFSPFFFFFTWPDGSYLKQPHTSQMCLPNTALRSPSCASSDRRGAKSSPSDAPFSGTQWNKTLFFSLQVSSPFLDISVTQIFSVDAVAPFFLSPSSEIFFL